MASIIVYFSRADNNYVSGTLKNLLIGNTEVAANMIQELTGADLFKAEMITPYSTDYNECIEEARQDLKRNARPELVAYPDDLDGYDIIYLGYPNYWGTMPMALLTLLEKYDFAGKTIKPFCTHEGSGMGSSEKDVKRLCKGAKVEKGLAITGARVNEAKTMIEQWL